jgi:hypothetical protein
MESIADDWSRATSRELKFISERRILRWRLAGGDNEGSRWRGQWRAGRHDVMVGASDPTGETEGDVVA